MGRTFEGMCRVCGESWTGQGITSHIKRCVSDHAELGAVHHGLLVGARADGPAGRYWLYLLVRPEAELAALDAALRERWFEADAPSVFEIEGTRYVRSIGGPEGSKVSDDLESSEETDGAVDDETDAPDEQELPPIEPMTVDLGAVLRPRMECRYLHDPRDPTEAELTVYDPYPVPDAVVEEGNEEADVFVLAQNSLEGVTCSSCDNAPSSVCLTCAAADEPEIGPFVCDECAGKHAEHDGELTELVNTPRR